MAQQSTTADVASPAYRRDLSRHVGVVKRGKPVLLPDWEMARGYRPQPLKRVYIPKSDGRRRGLSIPVMKDRARQALHLLALDPIAETRADPNSYGFRIGRAPADAIAQAFRAL